MITTKHIKQIIKQNPSLVRLPYEERIKVRSYAHIAGKNKLSTEAKTAFKNPEEEKIHNIHAQLITDFNLIYKNPIEIRLYSIGTLFTKSNKNSYNITNNKNYNLEDKSQQVRFEKFPKQIKNDLHIIKNSSKYFCDNNVKKKIESTEEYKAMFNKVMEELKTSNIQVRLADISNAVELSETGYNVLINLKEPKDKSSLMTKLEINKEHGVH